MNFCFVGDFFLLEKTVFFIYLNKTTQFFCLVVGPEFTPLCLVHVRLGCSLFGSPPSDAPLLSFKGTHNLSSHEVKYSCRPKVLKRGEALVSLSAQILAIHATSP